MQNIYLTICIAVYFSGETHILWTVRSLKAGNSLGA